MFYLKDNQSTMESKIVTQAENYIFDSLVFDAPLLLNQRRGFLCMKQNLSSLQFKSFRLIKDRS